MFVVGKNNFALDFIKNNTLQGGSPEGIFLEKIQGRVNLNILTALSFIIVRSHVFNVLIGPQLTPGTQFIENIHHRSLGSIRT